MRPLPAITLSLLILVTGGFYFAHQAMTAELIITIFFGLFLLSLPLIALTEKRT